MSAPQESIAALVREVQDASSLPATLAELSSSDRKAIEVQARWKRITPEAALAIMRAERAKERELRDTVDGVLATIRASR